MVLYTRLKRQDNIFVGKNPKLMEKHLLRLKTNGKYQCNKKK